ncbi:MAG: peptidylprolyl isomerase [Planctomycetota bacterium]|jgi:cyclophilin family peptidyl-prolyl cis-trans isomerase
MDIKLELDKDSYNLAETVTAKVTVTNDGDTTVTVPKPQLCLPSVSFRVSRDPSAPTPQSFVIRIDGQKEDVTLQPGESVSGDVTFPAVESGETQYEVYYNPQGDIHPTFEGTHADVSNAVTLKVADGDMHARLETEAGQFVLEFFPERALNHVVSWVELAKKGYYDGIKFHRVVPGFVIQGGDPTGTGSGGPGYKLPAEFNEIPHVEGTLSMARTSDPHSAGSQFFVCTADCPALDNEYTVFGQVRGNHEPFMTIGASEDNAGKFHMTKVIVSG